MTYSCSKLSSPGGRSVNEDSVGLQQSGDTLIAIVADGLGGLGGGDVASQTAVSAVLEYFDKEKKCSPQSVTISIEKAEEAVIAAQNAGNGQGEMKTTIVLLCVNKGNVICAHLGDSRLYQFRNKDIIFQTKDHSVSQMAVSVGEISPDEIRRHADRNKLLRALGTKERTPAETHELTVQKGDGFLLCTDGFWELVLEDEMIKDFKHSKNADVWLEKMRYRLEQRLSDNSDNYSAIAVLIN